MRVRLHVLHEGQTYVGEIDLHPEGTEKTSPKPRKMIVEVTSDIARKPSAAVELLYRKVFFKESHKLSDVCEELRKQGYNFSRQSVFMALKAAPFLGVNGRRGSYVFVQKFPPQS